MDERTHGALLMSIAHWRDNAAATEPGMADTTVDECALCGRFYDLDCEGCPVAEASGKPRCDGTPYVSAAHRLKLWRNMVEGDQPDADHAGKLFREAAAHEVRFLESLLPKEEGS